MEIDSNVTRENVEKQVRELMEGEQGKKMKKKAMEWKRLALEATRPSGSSSMNLDKLVTEVLLSRNQTHECGVFSKGQESPFKGTVPKV
jgi:hypothetical protein